MLSDGLSGLYGAGEWRREAKLEDLNLVQGLDIDKFLELLNRNATPQMPLLPQTPLLSPKPSDLPQFEYTPPPTTQEILRGWVDEWVDSAKDEHGGEDPRERNFDKARGAALAAHGYLERRKFHLVASGNSLRPWFDTYERAPTIPLRALIGPRPEHYAQEQLAFFLLSNMRFRLAKCRKETCGTYFLLSHWNRRYKRGTLCKSCGRSRSLESAVKATAEVRKDAATQLHSLAAKKFARQIRSTSRWHQQKELKDRIADFLNAKIERSELLGAVYKRGITGKWVARSENWNGIETALKGGK
jgi:hypothetical protein